LIAQTLFTSCSKWKELLDGDIIKESLRIECMRIIPDSFVMLSVTKSNENGGAFWDKKVLQFAIFECSAWT
jgi:hypothetical protein